jgi:hypothetical protein
MYLQKVTSKTNNKKLLFVGMLAKATGSGSVNQRTQGSGSEPKCHGSGTMNIGNLYVTS